MSKTNVRKAVTCTAVKKNGERCKQTRGLVNGLCSSHRVAQPEGGAESFKNILDEVINGGTAAAPGMKLEFVKGQWTEVPADEVQEEVLNKSEELAEEHAVVVSGLMSFEEAAAILKQYEPLLTYVPESRVKDIREFAALVMDVVKMPYDTLVQEFMTVSAQINDMELTSKRMLEDAKAEYRGHVPLDIKMDIDKLNEEIFQLKAWKGLLFGTIEYTEKVAGQQAKPVQDDDDDKPVSFEDRFKNFFKGLVRKSGKWLMVIGALLMMVAIVYTGEKNFDTPNETTPPVVEENTPADVDVPVVVDDVPVDNADKSVPVAPVVPVSHVVQDGDTLWDIAEAAYGDGSMWIHIYNANADMLNANDVRNVEDPGHWIHAGQDLYIPTADDIAASNDH